MQTYLLGSPATASITVKDNDDPSLHRINIVATSISPVTEGDRAMAEFEITATGGTSGTTDPIDVVIEISEEGNFLQNTAGTRDPISVTPGAQGMVGTAVPLTEAIENDTIYETNGKIIAKIVSSTLYAVGENAIAEVVINNDDTLPVVTIAEARSFTAEGNPTAEGVNTESDYDFAVSLSEASPVDVEVNFSVSKAGDSATLNDDYTVGNATNTLTFPANSTDAQTINIKVAGDALNETNETFTITLSLPAGAPLVTLPQNPTITGTIPNDDTAPW